MSDNPIYAQLSTFEPEPIRWYWKYFLAGGIVTVLDGDPGVGKSFFGMKVSAEFSVGGSLPGQDTLRRKKVLYLTREDDPSYTIRPRIDSMGGDPRMISVQTRFSAFDKAGMKELWKAAKTFRPGLIVVDPLYSFIGAEADIYRPNEIRQALGELQEVADYCGAAVLVIRHLRKMKAEKAIYQGAGVIDVIGFARCGLLVAEDPDDPTRKIIAHAKHNLSKRMESIAYRLIDQGEDKQPRFEWAGTSALTADQLAAGTSSIGTPRDDAKEFLQRELAAGERLAQELFKLAQGEGISGRTLKRAKADLGVQSRFSKEGWLWKLK